MLDGGLLAVVEAPPAPLSEPAQRRALGWETVLLLGVSLGASGLYALLDLIDRETQRVALSNQTATLNSTYVQREWLDFLYQIAGLVTGFVAPALAVGASKQFRVSASQR